MIWRISGAVCVLMTLSVGVGMSQEKAAPRLTPVENARGPYEMTPKDAPLEAVLENFLGEAAVAHGGEDYDDDIYREFCKKYGIDSRWRSADRLGTAFYEIQAEFGKRVLQASQTLTFKDRSGQDPNEWRTESFGEAFAGIYEELRAEGLQYDLARFVGLIDKLSRHGFVRYSDQPFDEETLQREADLFWRGAERVSAEAAQFHRQEVEQ